MSSSCSRTSASGRGRAPSSARARWRRSSSSSPGERRALVEEAAGLGRFKRRRHRAELKLARVAQQVERARDLEREVQKRLRPLALQASAAERAEKLGVEIRRIRAGLAALDLAEYSARAGQAGARKVELEAGQADVQSRLDALLAERERAEGELAAVAGGQEGAAGALYRLRSARERVEMRREAASGSAGAAAGARGPEARRRRRRAGATCRSDGRSRSSARSPSERACRPRLARWRSGARRWR